MATIAEFLMIKIGIDNDSLKKDADKAKKNIESVEKKIEEFKNTLKKFTRTSLIEFFTALASSAGITAFITNVTAADAALGRLSKTTGMSVEAISAWSNAAERAGGSAAEMQSGIANMSKELTNFKYTGESTLVPFLAQMGVSIVDVNGKLKDQNQIMLELADRAQNMPKEDFANLAMANGFNQSQVNLMLQGRKALQQQINEQNRNAITTKQQAEQAQKLETAWMDLKQSFMGVARQIAYVLVPPLTVLFKVLAAIFTFIGTHKLLMYSMFALAIPKVLGFVKMLTLVMRTFNLLTPIIKVATLAMRGFGISSALALAPLLLLGAGIALLFDDFMTFQAGGDSLIPWDKVFGGAKTAIQDIKDLIFSVGTLMDLLKAVGQGDWKAAASLGKKLIMDATPIGMMAKIADRKVTGGKNIDAVNKDAVAASNEVHSPVTKSVADTSRQTAENSAIIRGAVQDLGVNEKQNAKTIMGYQKDIGYMSRTLDAWCASFVGSKLQKAGYQSTHSASAASYLKYGKAADLSKPLQAGMIGLVKRKGGSGYHVFLIEKDNGDGTVSTIEGNYRDRVMRNRRKISSLAAVRTPVSMGGKNNNTVSAGSLLLGAYGINDYFKYDDIIKTAAAAQGIPAEILKGLIHQESHFNPKAVSHRGAKGIAQFTSIALKDQKQKGYNIDPWNVNQSIHGAARILRDNYKKFGSWEPAIAAYNAGAGAVAANGNRPLTDTKEHREYAKGVLQHAKQARFASGGFLAAGARGQAALSSGGANVNNIHSETHIGNININTMATDAAGVAKAIPHEIKNQYSKLAHAVSSGMS